MVLLLVVILCLLLVLLSAKDATSTSNTAITGAIAGAGSFVPPNFTEWANDVVSKVNKSLPDFDQWANDVVSKVNQTLPNFNQWANDVVSKVNQALPDFNQWANGVAQNTAQLLQNSSNFTEINEQILQTTRDSAQKLINIVKTLSNLEDTSTSIAGVVDDILLKALELLALHNDSTALPTSCKEIKKRQPLSPSGVYLLANTITAYCNMEELCGSGGGWTRLAYLNTTDPTENCPSGFRLYQSGGVRACGRATSSGGSCTSVQFPSNGISYSQVCGRVVGYQYGSTDANPHAEHGLDSFYIDGVSITCGSPRQHVWTLMAGLHEAAIHSIGQFNCPCAQNGKFQHSVLSFIGNDYFCESGNPATSDTWQSILYGTDPLWDGEGCGSLEGNCCNATGIPWFNKVLGTTTTDYLELRVCGDEGTANEDAPVSFYELYVK
uniref:Fibrinogen C-terminal domain-containing protein n=1 Tax=Amphimedon queenslandica TaxID=400682 RepID=A0A1X7SXB0_AMPQE